MDIGEVKSWKVGPECIGERKSFSLANIGRYSNQFDAPFSQIGGRNEAPVRKEFAKICSHLELGIAVGHVSMWQQTSLKVNHSSICMQKSLEGPEGAYI